MSNRSSHFANRLQTLPSALAAVSGSRRLLALAAVLALLALTLLPTAAQAQTVQAQTEIWSDTMTVGTLTVGSLTFLGWGDGGTSPGVLTDEDFDYGDHTYDFQSIFLGDDTLVLAFNAGGEGDIANKATRDKLTFHVGTTALNMGNGTLASDSLGVFWINSGLTWSDGDTVALKITTTDPGAPTLTATPGPEKVTLNWTPPTTSGGSAITGYEYRQRTGDDYADDAWTEIPDSASLTTYDVTGLTDGTPYTFQLRAHNSSGAGLYSNEVTATPPGLTPCLVVDGCFVVPLTWDLLPSGLTDGDEFRLLFVSSTTRKANTSVIANYNTFVQNAAASGHSAIQAYSSHFRAVGSTSGTDARDNTATTYTSSDKGVRIYWLNGSKVVDDYEDFYDGGWDDAANAKDESGNNRTISTDDTHPWTGSSHNGTEAMHLGNSRALGQSTVRVGIPPGDPLSSNTVYSNSDTRPLYALSPVFQVLDTPPALESATVLEDGTTLELVFDEVFEQNAAFGLSATDFPVTADGSTVTVGEFAFVDEGGVIVVYRTIKLKELSPAITFGQTVTVSYTDPPGDNGFSVDPDVGVLEDAAGNDVASFTTGSGGVPAVVNNVPPAPPGPPQNVVAEAFTGRVTLDWDPPDSEGDAPITHYEYRRQRGTGNFGDWTLVEDDGSNHSLGEDGTSLEFRDTHIRTDETFTYEVRAVNLGGPGPALASDPIDLAPASRFRMENTEVRVLEGVGTVTVNAVFEIPDGWLPYDKNLLVTFISLEGTATTPEDYARTSEVVVFRPEDFKQVDGRWIATAGAEIGIVGDRFDEDAEFFTLLLQRDSSLDFPFQPDTDMTKLTTTVVIENDDHLMWSVTAEPDEIGEQGGVSTVTVRTNNVEFTADQTITLTLGGESTAATLGTDFTVTDSNGAALASPYAITLAQGEVAVAALVITALADTVEDDDETVTITATLGADQIGETETLTISQLEPPGPPQNVVAEAFTGRVTLDWDPPASEGDAPITHYEYRRQRGTSTPSDWARVEDLGQYHRLGDDGTSLAFGDGFIDPGVTHTYEVRAVNAGGPGPALASNAIELPPATRFRMEQAEVRVLEGRGTVTVNAVMEVPAGWRPYDGDLKVEFIHTTGVGTPGSEADPNLDFLPLLAEVVVFRPGDFKEVNGRWIATRGAQITIVGDRFDEDAEFFAIYVDRTPDLPAHAQHDTDLTTLVTTVVIEDDDHLVWSVTAARERIREGGGVSAVRVRTNNVEFHADQRITLTLGGTATRGTDFNVTDGDGAVLASPYTITLPQGEVEVAAFVITALADTVADDDETVTIMATLGANQIGETETLTISEVDAPSAPRNLVVTAAEENTVMFRWDPPADDGGAPVTDYAYSYGDRTIGGPDAVWDYVGSTPKGQPPRRSWNIGVHADGNEVCVQVMAVNEANFRPLYSNRDLNVHDDGLEGNPSQVKCVVPYGPAEGAPEAPGWLRVTSTQSDRADLGWDEPDESGNSPLWGYRIEVSTNGGQSWNEVVENTGTPSRSWSDVGVDDLANRLYRVSAVNTLDVTGNPTPAASLAAMTLEDLRTKPAQHFENEGDERASSHSVTATVELTNPAPGRKVHVRLLRDGRPAETRDGEVVEPQVVEATGTSVVATFEDLPEQTTFKVTADLVASFDSPQARWTLAITLPDIRQGGGPGPGRGVEVDTDGDGVAEDDPELTLAMGGTATFWVRPGACTGGKQVWLEEFSAYGQRDVPQHIALEASPNGHTWTCADDGEPGEWRLITLSGPGDSDLMLVAPFDATVRHTVAAQRPAYSSWDVLLLRGHLLKVRMTAAETLAPVTGLAVSVGQWQPQVSWGAVAGAGAYQVQWRWGSEEYGRTHEENGEISNREQRVTGTSHTVAVPSAAKRAGGVTVRVRAYDRDALTVGPWREAALAAIPGRPSGLTAKLDSKTTIRLAWEAAAENGARIRGYGIEVSEDGARSWRTLVQDTGSTSTEYVHRNLGPGSQRFYRVRARNAVGTGAWSHLAGTLTLLTTQANGALSVSVDGLPESHDGSGSIEFKMGFSETVTAGEEAFRTHALSVTNGKVSKASLREDEPGAYDVTVTPDSDSDMTILLPGGRPCAETGAICTEDGQQLVQALSMAVPGPGTPRGPVVLTEFVLVDATAHADVGAVEDGARLIGIDPVKDYGFRVEVAADGGVGSVTLALSGSGLANDVSQTENYEPWSLYGDTGGNEDGAALPLGSYTLTATAWPEDKGGGEALQTLTVSFTVAEAQLATVVPNASATGLPTISGTAQVGQTLTADTSGIDDEDGLTNAVFSYHWVRNDGASDTNIQDATGSSYTLTEDDEGKAITVRVSFTDDANNEESLTSDPTGEVDSEAGPLTVFTVVDTSSDTDTVLGTLEDGGTLTLEDPDSDRHGIRVDTDSNDDIHKVVLKLDGEKDEGKTEWVPPYSLYGDEGEGNLKGENLPAGAYELKATAYDDDGDVLGTLKVSFTVTAGQPAQRQTVVPNTSATGVPTISGTAQVGQTLTADVTGIADEDGLDNVTFSYQWMADDTNIQGATGSSYTLTEGDKGKAITVTVSFTDAEGNPETLTSDPTGEVAAAPAQNIQATGLPTISGMAQVGETLTADTSGIADEDGLDNVTFSYQWMANDANIQGATDRAYTLADRDEGKTIKVIVSFTDDANNEESLTSDPTGEVAAAPAQNIQATGQPTISGMALVGQTLTADTTGIADEDGLDNVTFSYQWMADDANIQGATDRAYTLTEDDKGKAIKVIVSFTDDANNEESLPSTATDAVTALPGKPQSLAGKATAQEIKLTWKAPTGPAVVEYVVYRGILQNGSMNGQALSKYATIDAAGKAMTYTDGNVEEGVEYRYRVAAVNADGEGKKSTWLDITAE